MHFLNSLSNTKQNNEIIDVIWHSLPLTAQIPKIISTPLLDSLSDVQRDQGTQNAVFGLISSSGAATPAVVQADDPIASLYDQYCSALDDPQAALKVEWMAAAAMCHTSLVEPHSDSRLRFKSTDALSSDTHRVEDLFGKLDEHTLTVAALAPATPEILRLFAPAESRKPAVERTPSLTRREHHAVTLDSALDNPRVASSAPDVFVASL